MLEMLRECSCQLAHTTDAKRVVVEETYNMDPKMKSDPGQH